MTDLISRQAATNTVFTMRCRCDTNDIDDYANMILAAFDVLPTVTIYGYPLDALACVAEVMREKGITVEEAVEGMRNVAWCAEMIGEWHKEVIERTISGSCLQTAKGYLKGAKNEADEN